MCKILIESSIVQRHVDSTIHYAICMEHIVLIKKTNCNRIVNFSHFCLSGSRMNICNQIT